MIGRILQLGTAVVKGVSGFVGKKQDLAASKETNLASWEASGIKATKGSWKDEFWTIIIGFPIILRVMGVMVDFFGYGSELSEMAWQMMLDIDTMLGGNYHLVVITCVSASFGVRLSDRINTKKITNPTIASPVEKIRRKFTSMDWNNK